MKPETRHQTGRRLKAITVAAGALALVATGMALAGSALKVPEGALAAAQQRYARVAAARQSQGRTLDRLFGKAGVPYPAPLFVRAFKEEGVVELWGAPAGAAPLQKITTWPFTGYSGELGPKRRRGDRQIPEGFYLLDGFNGVSRYHLSIHVSYPNASDRQRGNPRHPGSNIFIHGNERTDGCIPIGDRAIEQLYIAVLDSQNAGYTTPVHIFPCRFDTPSCARLLRATTRPRSGLATFWSNLEEGFWHFAATGTLPLVGINVDGRYTFAFPDVASSATP